MRLQRIFLYLVQYSQMNMVHTPDNEMLIADCSSCTKLPEFEEMNELFGVVY